MEFDFAENAVVKVLDAVPEQFRPLYIEDKASGTFKLKGDDPSVKGAVEAIQGLNKALRAERTVTKELRNKAVDLAPLGEYGKTPEEIAAGIRSKIEELQAQVASGKGAKLDLEKIRADLAAGHAKDVKKKEEQIAALRKQLETILVDNTIRTSLGDQAVDPDLVVPFVKDRVKAVDEEGKIQVYVVDEGGNRRYSGATGGPLSINELIAEMKTGTKFAPLFRSQAPRGSGSPPGGAARKPTDGNAAGAIGQKTSPLAKITRGLAARAAR